MKRREFITLLGGAATASLSWQAGVSGAGRDAAARRDEGLGVNCLKYLGGDAVYVGVMVQEVALIDPQAMVRDQLTGYLSVDYARPGNAADHGAIDYA